MSSTKASASSAVSNVIGGRRVCPARHGRPRVLTLRPRLRPAARRATRARSGASDWPAMNSTSDMATSAVASARRMRSRKSRNRSSPFRPRASQPRSVERPTPAACAAAGSRPATLDDGDDPLLQDVIELLRRPTHHATPAHTQQPTSRQKTCRGTAMTGAGPAAPRRTAGIVPVCAKGAGSHEATCDRLREKRRAGERQDGATERHLGEAGHHAALVAAARRRTSTSMRGRARSGSSSEATRLRTYRSSANATPVDAVEDGLGVVVDVPAGVRVGADDTNDHAEAASLCPGPAAATDSGHAGEAHPVLERSRRRGGEGPDDSRSLGANRPSSRLGDRFSEQLKGQEVRQRVVCPIPRAWFPAVLRRRSCPWANRLQPNDEVFAHLELFPLGPEAPPQDSNWRRRERTTCRWRPQ